MATKQDAIFKMVGYSPHREQLKFHSSGARFRVACCGRRFGKSTMAARDLEPSLLDVNRSLQFWAVGPTYDLGEKEFRVVWNDLMIKLGLGKDKRIKRAYNKKQGNMFIQFPWGTRFEVRSADHPDYLVGEALDGVIVSEAAKQQPDVWTKYLMPSLSDRQGFATFPTTPEGQNWLYRLWQQGQNPKFKNWASWQFPSWANEVVYPLGRQDPEILELEQSLSKEEFDQEIGAEFTAFVGKIYGEFDEKMHVKTVEYDPSLPNYIAFDWGFAAPMAAVEFQVDADDNIRVWRIYYKSWQTLNDNLKAMKDRPQPAGYKIDLCFGDAASPDNIQTVNQSFAPCIGDPAAKTDWLSGVMLMKRFLKPRDTGLYDTDGFPIYVPKFFVDYSCDEFINEISNYRSKKPPKGRNAPELPQGIDDHCMDAIRYGLMHLFHLGAQHHLSEVADVNGLSGYVDDLTDVASPGAVLEAGMDSFFTIGDRF